MSSSYAAGTDVSSDRSIAEIRRNLQRYNADQFMYAEGSQQAMVQFVMRGRRIRFVISMPDREAHEFTHTPGRGLRRSPAQAAEAWEQAIRQRWRALNLVIKAKLEAVESGIADFQSEFLGQIVLPNGHTVAESVNADIDYAYETNEMPALLPELKAIEGGTRDD